MAVLVECLVATTATAADEYTLQMIPPIGGGPTSDAWAINEAGYVTGSSQIGGGSLRPILFRDGVMTILQLPAGSSSAEGTALNSSNTVVGFEYNPPAQAYRWGQGSPVPLGFLQGGMMDSQAYGINDLGTIVGHARDANGNLQPVIFANGSVTAIGGAGVEEGGATAINSSNQIVGRVRQFGVTGNRAFLYDQGAMVTLGTLGGTESVATALNDATQIVGRATTSNGHSHAFLFEGSQMIDLGTLGGTYSEALGINAAGIAVGISTRANGDLRAFIRRNDTMIDLNTLVTLPPGWTSLSVARGINDVGQIVGQGRFNGFNRGFVLTPVPAPAGLALLVAAGGLQRRRRRVE